MNQLCSGSHDGRSPPACPAAEILFWALRKVGGGMACPSELGDGGCEQISVGGFPPAFGGTWGGGKTRLPVFLEGEASPTLVWGQMTCRGRAERGLTCGESGGPAA